MSGVTVKAGATVNYSIVDENTEIGANSVVGRTKTMGEEITVVGSGLVLNDGANIPGGTMVNNEWLKENK